MGLGEQSTFLIRKQYAENPHFLRIPLLMIQHITNKVNMLTMFMELRNREMSLQTSGPAQAEINNLRIKERMGTRKIGLITRNTDPIVQIGRESVHLAMHTCSHPFGPRRYSGADTGTLFPCGQE